ncbi:MAG: poly(R)-hydroxyalkanoic acid synthase subunit PhaE [Tepidiformaceae bacterium]
MAQGTQADPFEMWRDWMANSERQWNGFLNNAMATDQFTQSMGQFMDVYLNMQKSMNEVMGRYMSALNLPTRNDILTLGERLSAIEDHLGTIESALGAMKSPAAAKATTAASPGVAARPPRTKKPRVS